MNQLEELRKRVRAVRKLYGISIEKICREAGLSRPALNNFLFGGGNESSETTIIKIENFLERREKQNGSYQ